LAGWGTENENRKGRLGITERQVKGWDQGGVGKEAHCHSELKNNWGESSAARERVVTTFYIAPKRLLWGGEGKYVEKRRASMTSAKARP